MTFAFPIAFVLTALAVPIIVFYILKVRLRRVPVSTNLFWSQIYDEKPPRSIWQYLKHLLSLLLQLLFLLLLVFALADPYFPWQLLQARRIAVVIDNSASMQTADVQGQTRFAAAIDQAHDLVDGLRFRDEMAIVLAGARPEVVLGMSSHAPTLKRTLNQLSFSDNPTHIDSAIELGRQLIGEHPHGEILVLTDGCFPQSTLVESPPSDGAAARAKEPKSQAATADVSTGGESEAKVRYQIVGSETANVGITQFQVRRSLVDPLGYEILASVKNASAAPVHCRLELELDGVPVDVLPLELQPEEAWSRSLDKTSIEGGVLLATLTQFKPSSDNSNNDAADASNKPELNGLQTDDQAWAILPARQTQDVLIVTPGNLFLQKVFEANPLVNVQVRQTFPEEWPADALIVLHGEMPETLPSGDLFIIDPTTNTNLWQVGEPLENPIVTDMDTESLLMMHVRLDNVLVPRAKKIEFEEKATTLAGTLSGDPIYVQLRRPTGKALLLNVNLEESDLAFRTAFPILVTNALGWFAGESGELRPSLATGQSTNITLDRRELTGDRLHLLAPDESQSLIVLPVVDASTDPGQDEISAKDSDQTVTVGPFPQAGVWRVNENDGTQPNQTTHARIAVNLNNARETDLRPLKEFENNNLRSAQLAGTFTRPLWFYLVCAAGLLTMIEWFLYQRRVIS